MKKRGGTLSQVNRIIVLLAVALPETAWPQENAATNTTPSDSSNVRQGPKNSHHDRLLAEEVDLAEQQWLETENNRFLALWRPDSSGEPVGAALILHESPALAANTDMMRRKLSESGWGTLAVSMPEPIGEPVPPRPQADENDPTAEQGNGADVPGEKPANGEATARLQAAFSYLADKGQFNIVLIAQGHSARQALDHWQRFSASSPQAIRAIVLIEAKTPDAVLAGLEPRLRSIPILDITFIGDQRRIKDRRQGARAANMEAYYAVIMAPLIAAHPESREDRLSKRVRSFLHRHARGVEIAGPQGAAN